VFNAHNLFRVSIRIGVGVLIISAESAIRTQTAKVTAITYVSVTTPVPSAAMPPIVNRERMAESLHVETGFVNTDIATPIKIAALNTATVFIIARMMDFARAIIPEIIALTANVTWTRAIVSSVARITIAVRSNCASKARPLLSTNVKQQSEVLLRSQFSSALAFVS